MRDSTKQIKHTFFSTFWELHIGPLKWGNKSITECEHRQDVHCGGGQLVKMQVISKAKIYTHLKYWLPALPPGQDFQTDKYRDQTKGDFSLMSFLYTALIHFCWVRSLSMYAVFHFLQSILFVLGHVSSFSPPLCWLNKQWTEPWTDRPEILSHLLKI